MKKLLVLPLLAFLLLSSCQIENPTYPFRVKVTNASGVPIQNVIVEASVDVPGYREEAYFIEFDEAVLALRFFHRTYLG